MIHEVSGDILLSGAQAIAHGVAPHDHFDQGLALSLRERWPAMYKDFRHYCHVHNPHSGGIWAWMGADGTRIVNLLTQTAPPTKGGHPGPASMKDLGHSLKDLRNFAEKEQLTSLALPKLATGVGGLDWAQVKPEIRAHLGGLSIPVIVYSTYHKGVQAKEPLGV